MSRKAQSHELTYDLIKRAVHGEPAAIEEYLLHYDACVPDRTGADSGGQWADGPAGAAELHLL